MTFTEEAATCSGATAAPTAIEAPESGAHALGTPLADAPVVADGRGTTLHGREELRQIEEQIVAVDATRRMVITKMVASGDTVAAEMDSYWRDDSIVARART